MCASNREANMPNITLDVAVSARSNVSAYQMVYGGAVVPMNHNLGQIIHPQGETHHLEWSMIGEPGGSMKVEVKDPGGTVVAVRNASKIPNSTPAGYDRLKIDI